MMTTKTSPYRGGCFGATSTATLVDEEGSKRVTEVQNLRKGDVVLTEGGGTATVVCVVQAAMPANEPLVSIPGGPTLTLHHPVRFNGAWRAPEGLGPIVPVGNIRTVYNFVLDSVHVMMVDGWPCVTLGHGLTEPGALHAFYGTQRCIDSLKGLEGWAEGFVRVAETLRDADGHACGFVAAAPEPVAAADAAAAASAGAGAGAGAATAAAAAAGAGATAGAAATTPATPAAKPHQDLCAICMAAPATHATVPCGHQCGCEDCLEQVRASGNARCPICRTVFTAIMHVIAAGVEDNDDDAPGAAGSAGAAAGAAGAAGAAAADPADLASPLDAFHINDDGQRDPPLIAVSTTQHDGPVNVLFRITCPEVATARSGADIAIAVDVSGSMGMDATYEDEQGNVRTDGLSVLCIAQRAVRVVAASLTPGDRLAVISFDQTANIILPLTAMNAAGKAAAEAAITRLRPNGQTNIYGGLMAALDALGAGAQSAMTAGRQQTVLLLTDGQPNVPPPGAKTVTVEAHVIALKQYIARHPKMPTIRTFGFGYDLDSDLLLQIARLGGGTFAFIPVTPVMGTVFVHAIANTLSMYSPNAQLSLAAVGEATFDLPVKRNKDDPNRITLPGGVVARTEPWGLQVSTGPLQCGSSRDIVVKMVLPAGAPPQTRFVNATLDCGEGLRITCHGTIGDVDPLAEIAALRAAVMEGGFRAVREGDNKNMEDAHKIIDGLLERIDASRVKGDERVAALRKDVSGRVRKSLDGAPRFLRWGRHYLRALFRAHEVQQCTNVLDFGVQGYGGALFAALREHGNKLFLALPPPEAPRPECPLCHRQFTRATIEAHSSECFGAPPPGGAYPQARAAAGGRGGHAAAPAPAAAAAAAAAPARAPSPPAPTIDVNNYTTGGGGCFAEGATCVAVCAGGVRCVMLVKDLIKGDVVEVANAKTANVVCVVEIAMPKEAMLVSIPNGPTLTPHHPVFVDGQWRMPEGLGKLVPVGSAGVVYNVVLDNTHVLLVDGLPCVTLGHGLTEPGVAHAFYGTQTCVDALAELNGWEAGFVKVAETLRDAEGHASGFRGAREDLGKMGVEQLGAFQQESTAAC